MALITSAASGNFSAGATWTGGVVPTVGDEARASTGHTVTIDVNTTCDEISNAGTGKFVINDGVTLTANVTAKSATFATNCLEFSANSPATANVVGNILAAGTANMVRAVANLGTGTLNITGNCQAVLGNVFTGFAVNNNGAGIVNITGNCTGGSFNNISSAGHAVFNNSTGQINITGNCFGGTNAFNCGAFQNSTGTLSIIGTVTASQTAAGVAGANVQQVTILSGPFITETTRGVNPVYCAAWRWNASPSNSTYLEVMTNDLLTKRSLVTEDNVVGMPAEADVKDGVVYGPTSALTGTFEQTVAPSISDITKGVWDYALSAITTSDTIGTLLKTNIDATISSRSTATTAGTAAAVWDRVLTGATHNIPSSAGRRLRILDEERIIADGQVVSATTNTITLQPIGSLCVGQTIVVTSDDTGEKQTRFILAYDSATNTASVDTQWCNIPQAGDEYLLTTVRDPLVTRNDHPAGTVGAEIDEMYLIHGLKDGEVLTVTPTSRTAGAIAQTIGGDGTNTTTVSRD
jgi:hypothetical protein